MFDSDEIVHSRSMRLIGMVGDLHGEKITMDQAMTIIDYEERNAKLENMEFFDGVREMCKKVKEVK